MTEPVYKRINFSTATAPASSNSQDPTDGGKARIALQLPNNFVDPARGRPQAVDLALTELSIPMEKAPVASLPLRDFVPLTTSQPIPCPRTSAILFAWPAAVIDGRVVSFKDVQPGNRFIYPNEWQQMEYSYVYRENSSAVSPSGTRDKFNSDCLATKNIPFYTFPDYQAVISHWLTYSLRACLDPGPSDTTYQPQMCTISLEIINSSPAFRCTAHGYSPYFLLSNAFYDAVNNRCDKIIPRWRSTPDQQQLLRQEVRPFSIVANLDFVKTWPALPWVEIDFSSSNMSANLVPNGYIAANNGSSKAYVLQSLGARSETAYREYYIENSQDIFNSLEVTTIFDTVSICSFSPVSAITVTLDGAGDIEHQYPLKTAPASMSDALISMSPILEVLYPHWTTTIELSQPLNYDRNDMIAAAPFRVTANALLTRVLTLEVYLILRDGQRVQLQLAPGTNLTIQLTFAIHY